MATIKFYRTVDIKKIPKGISGVAYSRATGRQTTIDFAVKNPTKTFLAGYKEGEFPRARFSKRVKGEVFEAEAIYLQLETEAAKREAARAEASAKRLKAAAEKVVPSNPAKKTVKKAAVKKAATKAVKRK